MARLSGKKKVKHAKVSQFRSLAAAKTKRFKAAYKPKVKPKTKKRPVEDIEIPD